MVKVPSPLHSVSLLLSQAPQAFRGQGAKGHTLAAALLAGVCAGGRASKVVLTLPNLHIQ